MRIVVFFVWLVGVVMGVPALYLTGMVWREVRRLEASAPATPLDARSAVAALADETIVPPTDASGAFPGARTALLAVYADDTRLVLLDCGDASGASAARQQYLAAAGAEVRSATDLLGRFSTTRFATVAGEQGMLVAADGIVAIVVGPGRAAVDARLAALRARDDVPQLAWALSSVAGGVDALLMPVLLPIGLWTLLAIPWFARMASWAGARPAQANATPVDAATLRARLLALGPPALPIEVTASAHPDELYVDWRYADARLAPSLAVSAHVRTHRIVLRLDAAGRRVRVQDRHATLDGTAGVAPRAATLTWRASRGITLFQYEHRSELTVRIEGGRVVASPKGTWTFDLGALRAPVIAVVTGSGWEWRPVLTFWRPLGG